MVTKITTITNDEQRMASDFMYELFKNVYDNFPLQRGLEELGGQYDMGGKTLSDVGPKVDKLPTNIVSDKDGFQYFHPVSGVVTDYPIWKMGDVDGAVNLRTLLNIASIMNEVFDNNQSINFKIPCNACASINVPLRGPLPLIVDGVNLSALGDTVDNDDQFFTMYWRDEKIKEYLSNIYNYNFATTGDVISYLFQTKPEMGIHNNLVLLTNQTNPTENGRYAYRVDGDTYILELFEDDHGLVKEGNGFIFPIATGGATNGGKLFMQVKNDWKEDELRITKTNTWRFYKGTPFYDGVTKFAMQFREISCNTGTTNPALPAPMTYVAPLDPMTATLADVRNKINEIYAAARTANHIST
jgi:hypothetical protein